MSRTAARNALVGFVSSLLVCCRVNTDSPDFPNGDSDDSTAQTRSVSRWSVRDAHTERLLTSGCERTATVSAVPEQQLWVELWKEYASVQSTQGLEMPDGFWCSDNDRITRQPDSSVASLACWRAPQPGAFGAAAKVLDMDVLPAERNPNGELPADVVAGRGYRFRLEVVTAGPVTLESTERCDDTDVWNRVTPSGAKAIVEIECGTETRCPEGQKCVGVTCAPAP